MNPKILVLQEKYKKGELKKAQYLAELAKLVESKAITQEEMDDATDYNPEEDKPIYTQADVDGMVARKAAQQIRKILKDAGVEIDANNKDLSGKIVELVKVGAGKMEAPKGAEVEALKVKAGKVDSMAADVKALRLENALLKTFAKPGYNPVSQAAVVALIKSDYAHLIEYRDEDTGEIDTKSVDRIVKRMQLDEPTLFKTAEGDDNKNKGGEGDGFRGKGPGGSGSSGSGDKNHDTNKARALEMMGLGKKPDDNNKTNK